MKSLLLVPLLCLALTAGAQNFGGPDQFGYIWKNNLHPSGPVFDWIDIDTLPGTITVTGLMDDNVVGPFNMPIAFQLYGNVPTQFWIGSNGYVSFNSGGLNLMAHPFPQIPAPGSVNNYLAVMVSDLTFSDGTFQPLPNASCNHWSNNAGDTMIISFNNVPFWNPTPPNFSGQNSFQVIFCATDQSVTYQYQTQNGVVGTGPASFMSAGIENQTGSTGLQVYYDVYPQAGTAVKFVQADINLITGKTYMDWNGNSVQDTNDYGIELLKIEEQNSGHFVFSNPSSGSYVLPVINSGLFSVLAPVFSNNYYNVNPSSYPVIFTGINQVSYTNDFAIQPVQVANDLTVDITPLSAFRPGFNAQYLITYTNAGTTTLTPEIYFYPHPLVDYVNASITPDFIYADSVVWQASPLDPLQSRFFIVSVHINSTTPINTIINSGAKVEPVAGDNAPANNVDYWEVLTTGSYDPNDILVSRSTLFTTEMQSPPFLEYIIRFQNTGNDTAFTVKILNPISASLDINTFELLGTSAPVSFKYYDNIRLAEFLFDNILLPDSNTNEPMSHGFIRYRVKPIPSLAVGTIIRDSAAIYFDFNTAVITNTALTEIIFPTGLTSNEIPFQLDVHPNPVLNEMSISFANESKAIVKMELLDVTGQVIEVLCEKIFAEESVLFTSSVTHLPAGVYLLKITSGETIAHRRIVKTK